MKQLTPFIILTALVLLSGCGDDHGHAYDDEDAHSHEGESQAEGGGVITQWTDKTELFMEYPALIVGREATFAVHLTRLSDFKPVSDSEVAFVFSSERGNEGSLTETEAQVPGIYGPDVIFERAGRYDLNIIIKGMVNDTLQVKGIPVYSSAEELPHAHDDENPDLISFLKEQQWNIPFGTEPVSRQTLFRTVEAHGETQPVTQNESILSAPFAGVVLSSMNRELPVAGQQVSKGQTLLRLNPAVQSEDGANYAEQFINAQSRLELAENNFQRSERLFGNEAIPEAELEQARMEYRQALIRYQTIHETLQIEPDAIDGFGDDAESYRFELKAPIDGTIVDMFVTPGMQVRAGAPLFRIADLSSIRLDVHLPAHLRNALGSPESAVFSIQGSDRQITLEEVDGKLISRGAQVDPQTRTISLMYQINNENQSLQTGLFTTVEIETEQKQNVLTIPESALIEEEGTYAVFVHQSGELFEKREVTTGIRNRGRVEIVSGLEEGERVVTTNAYRVKMASLSSEAPAHGHAH